MSVLSYPRWPHQQYAYDETNAMRAAGMRRMCIASPTGAGKTRCQFDQIEKSLAEDGGVLVLSNRRMLLTQHARNAKAAGFEFGFRAANYRELVADCGMDIGFYRGSDMAARPLQLAMTQTECNRVLTKGEPLHQAKLVIIDEAHLHKSEQICELTRRYQDAGADILGYTATPVDLASMQYERLIVAGTTSELRACGALVPAITYAPDEPNLKEIETSAATGEFSEQQIVDAMFGRKIETKQKPAIVGRVLEKWRELNPEALPTLLFAPSVATSIWFAEAFQEAGYRAAHIDGEHIWLDGELHPTDKQGLRSEMLRQHKDGELAVICNRFVCLDSETEILTDRGWVGEVEMTPEHNVANWDDGRVFFEPPRRIVRRSREADEKMVALETPRRSIRVTGNHELLYRTTADGRFLKDTAENLVNRAIAVPVSGRAEPAEKAVAQPEMTANAKRRITANAWAMRKRGFDAQSSRAVAEARIAERAAIKYRQPHELTNEECEFIGFWIGDGNRNKLANGGVEYRLSQAEASVNIISRVNCLCQAMGVDVIQRWKTANDGGRHALWSLPRGTGFGRQRRRGLFPIEPYLQKSGTELFWGLNEQQFDSLISGLWMADGCPHHDNVKPGERILICGVVKPLFDLLQAIAVCRGYRVSIRSYKQSNPKYQNLLYLTLTKTDEHRMTKYRLQAEAGWKPEKVWCVTTSSGNIITRRKGSVTVMGNCREGIDLPYIRCGIFATMFGGISSFLQSGGRLLRAAPGKDRVIVQDHGGNWWRHGSLNADREWVLNETNYQASQKRLDKFRSPKEGEPKEQEPVVCSKCARVRPASAKYSLQCPFCGHLASKKSRIVMSSDGTLKEVSGDIIKERKVKMLPNTADIWQQCYHRCKNAKRPMTFKQAMGLFFRENYYWPPRDLPFMPQRETDWARKIVDVKAPDLIGFDK